MNWNVPGSNPIRKVVHLTLPPHAFSILLKFGACYITGQWGRVQNKIIHFFLICVHIIIFTTYLRVIFYKEEMSIRLHEGALGTQPFYEAPVDLCVNT